MAIERDLGFGFKKQYNAARSKIGKLGLKEEDRFYYLFDFGDEWWNEVTFLRIQEAVDSNVYPKTVKIAGESPSQYPDYEGDEESD